MYPQAFNQSYEQMAQYMLGGAAFGALLAIGIIFVVLLIAAIYVYSSWALYTIGKKLKYKRSWLAWIPIVNIAMILQLGGFHWAWIFLIFLGAIPLVGWIPLTVLLILASWKMFEKRKYPGWFSLSLIIPAVGGILFLIALGFVAWKDKKKIKN